MRLISVDAFVEAMNEHIRAAVEWWKKTPTPEITLRAEQAVATGLCTGCPVADLETEWVEGFAGRTWIIKCTHEEACERASDKSVIEQDDGALLGIKIICEQRPSCGGCRYYITQRHDCGIGHPHTWKYFGGKQEGDKNV